MLGDTHSHMSRLQRCKILHVYGTLCFSVFMCNFFILREYVQRFQYVFGQELAFTGSCGLSQ